MTHPHFIPSHQPEDSESANPKFNYVFQMYGFMLGNIKHEGNGIWNRFNIIVGINIGLFGIIAFFNSDQTNSWQEIAIGIGAVGFIHSVWSIYVLRQLWRWHEYWREALIKIEKTEDGPSYSELCEVLFVPLVEGLPEELGH